MEQKKQEENSPIPVTVKSACATPAELVALAAAAGVGKVRQNYVRMFLLACAAGAFIGVGGMCSVAVGKGLPSADAGLQRFAFGAVFPVGLVLVVLTGAELITGNFAVLLCALLARRVRVGETLVAWLVVYAGNLAGALGLAYFLAFLPNLYAAEPHLSGVQALAEGKVAQGFGALVLSGVGCNWLVCCAVLTAMGARDAASKVLLVWFPIQTFVTIGFEHSVANMALVPIGILYGADVTFGEFVVRNLVPVTLGNMIGAWLLVALVEWYAFGINRSPGKKSVVAAAAVATTTREEQRPEDAAVEEEGDKEEKKPAEVEEEVAQVVEQQKEHRESKSKKRHKKRRHQSSGNGEGETGGEDAVAMETMV